MIKVFITGFMAAGKTYTAKLAARKTKIPFLDLDKIIENETGKSINDIFRDEGEMAFRKYENETLIKTTQENMDFIMACGGGILENKENLQFMKKNGIIVFIDTDKEILLQRLKKEKSYRPLIKDKSEKELEVYLRKKYKERLSNYHKADIFFKPEKENTNVLINKIKNFLY